MMKKLFFQFIFLVLLVASTACGTTSVQNELLGGSEAGNPPGLRTVEGTLDTTNEDAEFLRMAQTAVVDTSQSFCFADTVVAISFAGLPTSTVVAADCEFSFELITGTYYTLNFYKEDVLIARLLVNNQDGAPSTNLFRLDDAESAMDLGLIELLVIDATPENQPATQNDRDGDGTSDFTDTDDDGDGTPDTEEVDCDANGIADEDQLSVVCTDTESTSTDTGTAVDTDADDDGYSDATDAFPADPAEWDDTDGDGIGDNADNCEATSNSDQLDTDADAAGDLCDDNDDGDAVNDDTDVFPLDPDEWADADSDDVGDNADNCPSLANADQTDTDGDDTGDDCDTDDDNDGFLDDGNLSGVIGDYMCSTYFVYYSSACDDNCRIVANPTQADADYDGTGDACE